MCTNNKPKKQVLLLFVQKQMQYYPFPYTNAKNNCKLKLLIHDDVYYNIDFGLPKPTPTIKHFSFRGSCYNLLSHNCNNFSDDIAQFLCGATIPQHILDLPNEVLQTTLGPAIHALTLELEKSARPAEEEEERARANFLRKSKEPSPDFDKLNSEIEEARSEFKSESKSGDSNSRI